MGRKQKTDAAETTGLSEENRTTLTALRDALNAVLGGAAPAGDGLGGGDDGLGGGDDGLGGGDDGLGETPPAVNIEDVRTALKNVIKKAGAEKGKAKVTAILKKFGAATLPDLAEDKYQDAIDLAKKHS